MMKGIITKDLLGLRQVALTMGLLMVFYLFLGFMGMNSSGGGMGYLSVMALVINVMVPLSCAGYDEQCGWDQFGASLPVSRKQIVICRYIVNLLVIAFTTLVMLAGNILFAAFGGEASGIAAYLLPIVFSLIYIAIMIPIIYQFGVQKSRFIVIAVMILPSMLIAAFGMLMANSGSEDSFLLTGIIDSLSALSAVPVATGVTVAAVCFYALSILVSIRIYSKKNF